MDDNENIHTQLDTKIRVPIEKKKNIYYKIFKEVIKGIFLLAYFILINFEFLKLEETLFTRVMYVQTCILVLATIVLFELAYTKDNNRIALFSVELLITAIVTLFMPYIYLRRNIKIRAIYAIYSGFICVYYIFKAICIYLIEKSKYIKGLSDIKQIIDESQESYLDEVNEKRFDYPNSEKQTQININKNRKNMNSKENKVKRKPAISEELDQKTPAEKIAKEENVEKKVTASKKKTTKEVGNEESKPKRPVGRPRKQSQVIDNDEKVEEKPKRKRGRPRKTDVDQNKTTLNN